MLAGGVGRRKTLHKHAFRHVHAGQKHLEAERFVQFDCLVERFKQRFAHLQLGVFMRLHIDLLHLLGRGPVPLAATRRRRQPCQGSRLKVRPADRTSHR